MFDRIDARQDGIARGAVAVAMGSDFLSQSVRLVDEGNHLLGSELRRVHLVGQRVHAAGGAKLDDVWSELDLVPNRLSKPCRSMCDPFIRPALAEQVVADAASIGMAPA